MRGADPSGGTDTGGRAVAESTQEVNHVGRNGHNANVAAANISLDFIEPEPCAARTSDLPSLSALDEANRAGRLFQYARCSPLAARVRCAAGPRARRGEHAGTTIAGTTERAELQAGF